MVERDAKGTHSKKDLSFSPGEIYLGHFNRVLAFMLTRLPNREHALDCTQEVFAQLLKTNPSPDSIKSSISSYLYGIAHNVVADFFSSNSRPKLRHTDNPELFPDVPGLSPVDMFRLNKCMKKLQNMPKRVKAYFKNETVKYALEC